MATIKEIESMNYEGVKANIKVLEEMEIKGHQVLFVDFEDNTFGYSVCVFKNGKHMHYANDYELHHRGKDRDELRNLYITSLNYKLFTEEELLSEIKDYSDYQAKTRYLMSYWIMQFDYVSMFYIGKPSEELEKASNEWFPCYPCMCYVPDKTIVGKANDLMGTIETQWDKVKNNQDVFRKMVAYELGNHEYCITCDYTDTLDTLGLNWNELEDWQKQIFKEEGRKQIYYYLNEEED